jgi:hypothetical protein
MTRTDHDSQQLGGFERRLLDALTALDHRRRLAAPAVASRVPARRRVRRPLVLGTAVLAGVSIGGAAVAGIIAGPRTLQSASGETVAAGGEAILKGSGCAPATDVTLRLDTGPVLGQAKADAEGLFIGTVTIPATTAHGRHVVTAACPGDDGEELVQELPLTVSAAEEPTPLDPTLAVGGSASPGGVTHVKGAGCRKDSEVRIVLDAATPVTVTAGPEGQFFAELMVPTATALGQHKVTAICSGSDGSELIQTAPLTIVPAEPQPTETKPAR